MKLSQIRICCLTVCCSGLIVLADVSEAAQMATKPAQTEHPSMAEFEQIFSEVGRVEPELRNYRSILNTLEAFVRKYPGTEAALLSIIAVQRWENMGYISVQDATMFRELRDEFNPGKDELDELHDRYELARGQRNPEALSEIASQMAGIAEKYPGNLTRYIALSNLAGIYLRAGETKKALKAASYFLKEYPPSQTAMASSSTMEYANLFTEAALTAKAESVEAGISKYLQIAESHSEEPTYVIPALYEGGQLALKNERLDDATDLFMRLAVTAPEETDQRITLAKFRIGEVLLRQKNVEAALVMFRELEKKHEGDRFGREAADWIKFSMEIRAKLVSEGKVPMDKQAAGESILLTGRTADEFLSDEIESLFDGGRKKSVKPETVIPTENALRRKERSETVTVTTGDLTDKREEVYTTEIGLISVAAFVVSILGAILVLRSIKKKHHAGGRP